MIKCPICGMEFTGYKGMSYHFTISHKLDLVDYFIEHKLLPIPKCIVCGKDIDMRKKGNRSAYLNGTTENILYCNNECKNKSTLYKEKLSEHGKKQSIHLVNYKQTEEDRLNKSIKSKANWENSEIKEKRLNGMRTYYDNQPKADATIKKEKILERKKEDRIKSENIIKENKIIFNERYDDEIRNNIEFLDYSHLIEEGTVNISKVKCKKCNFVSEDINNVSGVLKKHLKEEHYITLVREKTTKQARIEHQKEILTYYELFEDEVFEKFIPCPICGKKYYNVVQSRCVMLPHFKNEHGYKDKQDIIKDFPEFYNYLITKKDQEAMLIENDYVECLECGEKLGYISDTHLKKHNMKYQDYINKYGNVKIINMDKKNKLSKSMNMLNELGITKILFGSKTSIEILMEDFLKVNDIRYHYNKYIDKRYFDFWIKGTNILIECDGKRYHPIVDDGNLSKFDKDNYDNDRLKDKIAKDNGYILYRISEDTINNKLNIEKVDNALDKLKEISYLIIE